MERVLLFNVGWMKHYRGQTTTDRIINGGMYVAEHEDGGEVTNFRALGGRCYGYARSPRGGRIHIERLGADAAADHVDGVTVVFVATRPEGGSVVVGWYRNARIWREQQTSRRRVYVAEASAKQCVLLPVDQRVLDVPRARPGTWGIGQSNVRYVDEVGARPFLRRLALFMENPSGSEIVETRPEAKGRRRGRPPRQSDPMLRAKVESAAIARVIAHYAEYDCVSVERENKGWDLELTRGRVTLLVEVKGNSGDSGAVELTPNEYAAMHGRAHRDSYRLAIVTRALEKRRARLTVVRFNGSDETWRDEDERKVKLVERIGVRVYFGALIEPC